MIKNLRYIFRVTETKMGKVIFWEFLHGLFLATPTGILLFIIWELFKPEPNTQMIWMQVGVMLFMLIIQLRVASRTMINTNLAIYGMSSKLRIMLGNRLQKLSLGYYKRRDPGDLASVVLQDVSNFETIFGHSAGNIFAAFFGTIFISIFLFIIDWKLALIMLSALPLAYFIVYITGKIIASYGNKQIAARNAVSSRFIEYIQGIRHLKAHNQTGNSFSTLKNSFKDLRRRSITLEAVPGPFILTTFIFLEFVFLFMVYVSIGRINAENLTIPAFIAFLIVGYKLYEPLKLIMIEYSIMNYMNVSLNRIIELLKSPLQDVGKNIVPTNYNIEFKNVTFSYLDREILKDVSFTIPKNGLTALVGASGSGKTTIANLIARFWDVQKGEIKIGNENIKDMSPQTVYSFISEVFQDVYLFDDTIYNNIKIGKPNASEEEIMKVAEKAQVIEFLADLSDGINTKVGEGGSHLSGGQKQRISIARAMLKDAPIILLDEATASLDPENEIYIQQAIQELVKEKTVVVIAHKLQIIRNADKIIVLENGKIKEQGKHQNLLNNNSLYANYWHTQQNTSGWRLKSN